MPYTQEQINDLALSGQTILTELKNLIGRIQWIIKMDLEFSRQRLNNLQLDPATISELDDIYTTIQNLERYARERLVQTATSEVSILRYLDHYKANYKSNLRTRQYQRRRRDPGHGPNITDGKPDDKPSTEYQDLYSAAVDKKAISDGDEITLERLRQLRDRYQDLRTWAITSNYIERNEWPSMPALETLQQEQK